MKCLAKELKERYLISEQEWLSVKCVQVRTGKGQSVGQWLDTKGVEQLLRTAKTTQNPARDQALIAVMCGCGLRRAEVCSLTWEHWQLRDGRWCIVNLMGKGGRVRTIGAPDWVAEYVNRWREELNERKEGSRACQSLER